MQHGFHFYYAFSTFSLFLEKNKFWASLISCLFKYNSVKKLRAFLPIFSPTSDFLGCWISAYAASKPLGSSDRFIFYNTGLWKHFYKTLIEFFLYIILGENSRTLKVKNWQQVGGFPCVGGKTRVYCHVSYALFWRVPPQSQFKEQSGMTRSSAFSGEEHAFLHCFQPVRAPSLGSTGLLRKSDEEQHETRLLL